MTYLQTNSLDDSNLMRRVAQADVHAFETVYDRYHVPAFSLAMRVTGTTAGAEEATQDAFLSLWRSARRYESARGNLLNWLLALVHNRSIDLIRRRARQSLDVEIDVVLAERLESGERTDDQVLLDAESRHMRELVGDLPDTQRQTIELAYFKGLSQSEIAAKLDLPLGTVKSRQRLALARLHKALTTELLAA